MAEVLGELIDASSVGGATFDLGSATYDMTRIATGQLDAYVEPGPRMVDEVEGMREEFERVGGGAVLNNCPYDLAAAALCLEEAGAVVTDAHGELARPAARCSGPGPSTRSRASRPPTVAFTPGSWNRSSVGSHAWPPAERPCRVRRPRRRRGAVL